MKERKRNSSQRLLGCAPPGVKLELGGHTATTFLEQDLIVVSPGVPTKIPALSNSPVLVAFPVWSRESSWPGMIS